MSLNKRNERRLYLRSALIIAALCGMLLTEACGVRSDMQDQPRYDAYEKSDFFSDGRSSRDYPEGTVARGHLEENKAFFTGKIDNPDPNAQAATSTDANGNTVVASFPNAVTEFPLPVTKELIDRGEDRYKIYCMVCHGQFGDGDGMVVRRGFPKPPTYHDDRLRNAPVGHFFDVITNGWGKMNSYGYQVQAADRWAIVAYIRALQLSRNPDSNLKMTSTANSNTGAPVPAKPEIPAANAATNRGGTR